MTSTPHGGKLVQVKQTSRDSPSLEGFKANQKLRISKETATIVANIANGVFSPLEGFMGENDYLNVIEHMRLESDLPWTIPILLSAPAEGHFGSGDEVLLVDESDGPVALMEYEGSFEISREEYASKVFGTEDKAHPGVAKVLAGNDRALAGRLKAAVKPDHGEYADYTLTPKETRILFSEKGWNTVVAFQTRNAPHINHEYLQKSALALVDGLFINPVLGKKKAGDFKDAVILSTYKAILANYYPKSSVVMSVLHYEMQYAGPKEAIMHAIMRKNFGCTHIIIGRDHAGVGNYYGPYAAQEIFKEFPDLGISPLFFKEFYYCKKCAGIASEKTCPHGEEDRLNFSGTKLRKMFSEGEVPPKEFMRPEVAQAILRFEKPFVE
ncbi:MAG TPA: sulfate adenylyltransferase [Nitrososphaerales archaeon]|nr:sulfate adenylyltransferase [Nitrososphaerales archaeon]